MYIFACGISNMLADFLISQSKPGLTLTCHVYFVHASQASLRLWYLNIKISRHSKASFCTTSTTRFHLKKFTQNLNPTNKICGLLT